MTVTMKSGSSTCKTTNHPGAEYNSNPANKQHTVVSIQLNIVTCLACSEKFIRSKCYRTVFTTFCCYCNSPLRK